MTKDTELFIKALKDGINKLQSESSESSENKSLRDITIDYLCKWSGCDREIYNESNLYDVVLMNFLDYLDTADKPSVLIQKYLDSKRLRSYLLMERNKTKVDDMLAALAMAQVKNKNGNYVNGFTKLIET